MARSLPFATAAILAVTTLSSAAPLANAPSFVYKKRASSNSTDIAWGPCADPFPSNVTCATYTAPLDWEDPGSDETVELGMVRIEARDQAKRIGNLFINPGGPGGQASELVGQLAQRPQALDPEVLDRFDIIGLDPRGVGLSTPVQCDPETYNRRVSFFPETQAQFDDLVRYNEAVAASCREKTGRLLDFVDTISAVRDHETVRQALGGEPVTFVGLSYGTQLFSQYAERYPDGVRALLLDGNLQHSQDETSNLLTESSTYETTLKRFFAWCAADDACPLSGQDVEGKYRSVLAKAAETPIPAPGCVNDTSCRSDVNEEELRFDLQGFLISTSAWPSLGQALIEAGDGDATLISQQQPLAVGDAYEDSYLFAGTAIACQDWAHASKSLADVRQKGTLGATFSPLTRGACQSYKIQTSCIGWPAPLSNPPKPVTYTGDITALMVNAIYDPSTSYTWAVGLHGEIENSVLLTRNGSGHTTYLNGLDSETVTAMNAYLLNLTLPEPGTVFET
ncbi:Alpha/Beta hydrolase protein [Xylariaceae sp. FL0662B]|nr:Alpha/Beta hydrolase protein [Xylariaceae sp. FL0662B]